MEIEIYDDGEPREETPLWVLLEAADPGEGWAFIEGRGYFKREVTETGSWWRPVPDEKTARGKSDG